MDYSGNSSSSSMKSSNGVDEEYDSRAGQSVSAFLNHHPHSGPTPNHPPPPPQNHHLLHHQSHFDNPLLQNYYEYNPLTVLSQTLRVDPVGKPSVGLFVATSPPSAPPAQPALNQTRQQESNSSNSDKIDTNGNNRNDNDIIGGRNRKKRSRASRRAPTTVLTTDPSNFRAMVQEFTGVPTPHLYTNNSNLFGSSSSSSPSYNLLRPFAQKTIPPFPFISSSSSSSLMVSSSASNMSASINNHLSSSSSSLSSSSSPSIDYHKNLNLQSLLHLPPNKHSGSSSSASLLGEKLKSSLETNIPNRSDHNNIRTGSDNSVLDELGLSCLQKIATPSDAGILPRTESTTASRNECMVEAWISSTDQ